MYIYIVAECVDYEGESIDSIWFHEDPAINRAKQCTNGEYREVRRYEPEKFDVASDVIWTSSKY